MSTEQIICEGNLIFRCLELSITIYTYFIGAEGLTLETSAKHQIPQVKNIPYQPLLITSIFSVLAHAEKQFFSKPVFQYFKKGWPKRNINHERCDPVECWVIAYYYARRVVCKVVSVSVLLKQQSVEGAMIRKWDPLTGDSRISKLLPNIPRRHIFDDLYFFLINLFWNRCTWIHIV